MTKDSVIIFTDGASKGNPGPGGWGAILVLPMQNKKNEELRIKNFEIKEIGGSESNTTNNRMELIAAIEALSLIHNSKSTIPVIIIYTDSNYLINGITKWVYSWQKRNWVTANKEPVLNKDLWEKLLELVKLKKIEWKHVKGHAGTPGNERADEIASSFAENKEQKLFSGNISGYKIDILNFPRLSLGKNPPSKAKPWMEGGEASKSRSRAKAYSYLSMVDGVIKKHKTWAECEKRVKGKSGAKFKKALNKREEKEIIESWSH